MTTKDVLERMPDGILSQIKRYKTQYKKQTINFQKQYAIREGIAGYVNGLRDAGFITEQERKMLYTYTTL